MKFTIDDFDVTVQPGRPEVKYLKGDDGQYRVVHLFSPEALIHPAFKPEFEDLVKRCIKMHMGKVNASKYLPNGQPVSHYIPPKVIRSGYSAYGFRKQIEERVGDIEEAKDDWDYNRAPAGAEKKGAFGDLKAFLQMRAGRELSLISTGRGDQHRGEVLTAEKLAARIAQRKKEGLDK